MTHKERDESPLEGNSAARPGTGGHDELGVQRVEEEASAGVRERQAGSVGVKKSVRTEREQVRVPRRREEVDVERRPVYREVPEGEIGGDEEVVIQVFEEEVVVSKRVVLKEEIRLRKRVVEEVEVAEIDLRKEEVEIDDQTEHRGRHTPGTGGVEEEREA